MVVGELDLVGSTLGPPEHDAPLVSNPDAVETAEVASKRFQAIARRRTQVIEIMSSIQHVELVQSSRHDVLVETGEPE